MIRKTFFKMAPAQIVSSITSMLCLLIDSVIIGRFLGVDAMSAYGLVSPLLIVFTAVALLLVCGVQVVCAKALGRGDLDQAGACYSASVAAALLIGALAAAAVLLAGDPICALLGAGRAGSVSQRNWH